MKNLFQVVRRMQNYCGHLAMTLIMTISMELKVGRFIVLFN